MSKQLTLASVLSVFALSALALFAAVSPHTANETGATIDAAPTFAAELPFVN